MEENLLDHLRQPEFSGLYSALSPRNFHTRFITTADKAILVLPDYKKAAEMMDERIRAKCLNLGLSA